MRITNRWRTILTIAITVYIALTLALVVLEPHLVFQPFDGPSEPAEAGLPHFTRKTLDASGVPTITYWENVHKRHTPTVFYFHGNGGGLFMHTALPAFLDQAGFHVIAMEYPSYPGAAGNPSEAIIVAQALALWDATAKASATTPSIWGYSLGTGVAVQLATVRTPASLVLEAPFTAVADRAAELFPIIPVRHLMKNQFRSRDYIARVAAPVFIMHGDADRIIPIHHGSNLYALANEPKTMRKYHGFGHLDLVKSTAYKDALAFLHAHTDKG